MNSTITNGLNANTPKNIIVDEGAVYVNYGTANEKCLGAVSGANEFDVKIKMWKPSVNAISDSIKGLEFIQSVDATLKCNFVEMTEDILKMSLLASIDKTTNTDYDIFTTNSSISSSDYIENVALVGEISGSAKPVVIVLKNVLVLDGIKIKRENAKTNELEVTFTPHVDPSTPHVVPFDVRYPRDNAQSVTLTGTYTSATPNDVTATIVNGSSVTSIMNGSTALTANTDYTVSGTTVKILKNYFSGKTGTATLTITLDTGNTNILVVTIG